MICMYVEKEANFISFQYNMYLQRVLLFIRNINKISFSFFIERISY